MYNVQVQKNPLLFDPLWKKIYGTTLICFRSHFVQKDAALIFQMRFMYEWDFCIFLIHVHNTLHTFISHFWPFVVRYGFNRNGSPQDLYEMTWMPHCTNKRCHVDSTCMTNLFNQVFVIGKFSRMYPTEQIDHTIDLGKLIKLTDRTIGQSYFLNGRTCTLESIQVLNFRLGIQIWQQVWTLHTKNGL